ncbi:MAG: hypothetical protein AB1801_19305 [Chloroflexota bacterium]
MTAILNLKRKPSISIARAGLFILILVLGTISALMLDETRGLALADLPDVPVKAINTFTENRVAYAVLGDETFASRLYRSLDNGHTWQFVGTGPGVAVNTLTVQPSGNTVLYAGTKGGPLSETNNVWRSDDGGQTWRNFNMSLPANPDYQVPAVTALAIDLNQPQLLYVGTAGQGVYRFREGEIGYELIGGVSLAAGHVRELAAALDGRLYALTHGGLFVTNGDDWRHLDEFPGIPVSLAVAPSDPQVLYAGHSSNGAYRSGDGGQTWDHIGDGLGLVPGAALRVTALAVDDQDPHHVMAATAYGLGKRLAGSGIYESSNGGKQWTKLADVEELITDLTFNDGAIYAATNKGLKRYGEPESPEMDVLWGNLRSLTHPTGIQLLVLTLSISLAGVILLGPVERMWPRRG